VHFTLTEEQSLLKDVVERFVHDRYDGRRRREFRASSAGYSVENWRDLAHLGILGLPFSLDQGGLGGGTIEIATVMEALGAGLVVEPYFEEVVVAARMLESLGQASQKQTWLPRIIAGDAHLALAHFEQGARFNLSYVSARAQRNGATFSIEGEKCLVPSAASADAFIVSARECGAYTDPDGIGFYLVMPHAAGLQRDDFRLSDGSVASAITLRNAVANEKLAGGFEAFETLIDEARIAACAEMTGIMSTLFQSTLEYLQSRRQFGTPLATLPIIRHRLADLYVLLEQSRSHLYRASLYAPGSASRERAVAGMKSYISAAAIEIGEQCIQLHGAIGITDELDVAVGHKRLLVLATMFGDSDSELRRFMRLTS